jgi:hypothetical protein
MPRRGSWKRSVFGLDVAKPQISPVDVCLVHGKTPPISNKQFYDSYDNGKSIPFLRVSWMHKYTIFLHGVKVVKSFGLMFRRFTGKIKNLSSAGYRAAQ